MVADSLDAGALIKLAVDEFAVYEAAGQLVQLALTEDELVFIQLLCFVQIALVVGDKHDLVQRLAPVFAQRDNGHALFHSLAPALGFAVQCFSLLVGKAPALDHLAAAKGGVPGFQRAFHAMAFQCRTHALGLLRLHGEIHQHLAVAEHIAACAAHRARKAVVPEQRFGHTVVAACAEKQFVAVGLCLFQRAQGAFRHQHIARRQKGAVDIQKNQLPIHTFPSLR